MSEDLKREISISITVSGKVGAGKSTVMQLIQEFLVAKGYTVQTKYLDESQPETLPRRAFALPPLTKVFLQEYQTPRTRISGNSSETGYPETT